MIGADYAPPCAGQLVTDAPPNGSFDMTMPPARPQRAPPVQRASSRKRTYRQVPNEPAEAGPKTHKRRLGYFLREWSIEIDSLIAATRHSVSAIRAEQGKPNGPILLDLMKVWKAIVWNKEAGRSQFLAPSV
jgi:hypothetical protein